MARKRNKKRFCSDLRCVALRPAADGIVDLRRPRRLLQLLLRRREVAVVQVVMDGVVEQHAVLRHHRHAPGGQRPTLFIAKRKGI